MTIAEIVVTVLVVLATICVVATTILQLRAPDALTRVNLLGTLVVIAFPILIVAKLIRSWTTTGFDLNDFIRAIIAVLAVWIVGSVASFIMGRSIYGVTVSDKKPLAEPRNR
ncbi:multicomponent Na+:H+ antiporter subunit G [Corynebacterium mucifaciens]|uniref:Na+/H+ antiporter subunit G n=1 Tax=Corynebacterium ureicelerivorans TaxID=401472 RepID=UPI00235736BB|nr:Na+/H+ antiporter subunit G [Corynebacterium ureicelerivorans]MDN8626105.1 Na+/H+ antiporter subunit G [Corynebacterium ureicelerivorans]